MSNKGILGLASTILVVFLLLIGFFMFVEKVPEGKVSVVYTPSKGATEVLSAGWHVVGLFEKTQQYPTRITIVKDKVSVTTSDGKKITMPVRYEMRVDSSKVLGIFKELGSQNIEDIQKGYLYQRLFEASRSVVGNYSVLDIYGAKATEASVEVKEMMAEKSKDIGFIVSNVTLGTPELDEATQKAIDDRVKTSQELEKKKIELELARAEAERKKVEASGEAEANKIISQSVTEQLIKLKEAEARMKHGWITVQGANGVIADK